MSRCVLLGMLFVWANRLTSRPRAKVRALLVLVCLAIGLAGCSSAHVAGRPNRSLDRERLIRAMEGTGGIGRLDVLVDQYYNEKTTSEQQKVIRDKIVDCSIVLIDQHYSIFVEEFSGGKKTLDTVADIGSMVTAATAVIVTPALTKSILAAVSAGITASKVTIEKNFFYDQTVPVLIKQMEAQRRTAVVQLIGGVSKTLDQYPLSAALADIEQYYFAGTFDGALSGIQQNAAKEKTMADDKLETLRRSIGAKLTAMRDRATEVAAIITADATNTKKSVFLAALEADFALRGRDDKTQFPGIMESQFDYHSRRETNAGVKTKLTTIQTAATADVNYWNDSKNWINYLKNDADPIAIGNVIAWAEKTFSFKIPIP